MSNPFRRVLTRPKAILSEGVTASRRTTLTESSCSFQTKRDDDELFEKVVEVLKREVSSLRSRQLNRGTATDGGKEERR